ncbi:GNAT family N-acetyltransferase [Bacillus sp. 165]|uniref:GNAT family N-acetyltransferase n=1 Tax=Bacillus sp. 165 TaxID=1529117 RepID=UPI001ADAAC12|nr:GNAT family N-acetyltransferase [Bacillus sp. 165]MBO9129899.1 GNAT family N-acetyltransferase [Bacillus sp. 165]
MGKEIVIHKITHLIYADMQPFLEDSVMEGHKFIERLVEEYKGEINTFSKQGEVLFGAYIDGELAGICGLSEDPYLQDTTIGRVRHLYVLRKFRKHGVGRLLMENIIHAAKQHFCMLTLWTSNSDADKLYRALGFLTEDLIGKVSHYLILREGEC